MPNPLQGSPSETSSASDLARSGHTILTTIGFAIFLLFAALTVIQIVGGLGFCRALLCHGYPRLSDEQCPKAAIILCLRGADPFLTDTIRAISDLDYPDYTVHIVVDSTADPALDVVQHALAQSRRQNLQVTTLQNRRDNCGLKCSSLLQAIAGIDETHQMVALLDADTVPHRQWLRDLAAPLAADPAVGVAAGNRWYMPGRPGWGDLVRYLWNASAVAQMYWSNFTWGGSLAIKTHVLRQTDLLRRWSQAFCEDTTIYPALREHGYRTAFVPAVMMVNRESCSLAESFPWMRRQLLNGRLYHPAWPAIAAHGAISTAAMAGALVVFVVAGMTGQWNAAAWIAGGVLMLQIVNALLLAATEYSVRKIVAARGEKVSWMSPGIVMRLMLAIPLTQFIYAAGLTLLVGMRRVEWRGITYAIAGPWNVQMTDYQPYQQLDLSGETTSL